MLKIMGGAGSSNVQKVLWCCAEMSLPFERIDIGAAYGGLRSPQYLALNPNGLMPTIDDEGFILWESNVCVRYLAAKHAAGTLYPTEPRERAEAERWMDWQQTTIAAPMGVLFRALLRKSNDNVDAAALDVARSKAIANWQILDQALSHRAFVGGERLTVGDIALGNAIHRWNKLPIERPPLGHLQAWYGRLCDRPAYRQHIVSALP